MIDDSPFTVQPRIPPQQQHFERPHAQQIPPLYSNQAPGGGMGMGAGNRGMFQQQQQPPFRVEPNPMGGLNGPAGLQQRLPPGLANLGGRPPHDPNGYINAPLQLGGMGMQGPGGAGLQQQQFNGFGTNASGAGGFGGLPPQQQQQQQRGPLPLQMLNNANALAASGHPDFTVQPPPIVRGPPPRGMHGGFGAPGGQGPMQGPLGMRTQQGGPHMLPQMMPPHIPQQQLPGLAMHGGQAQTQNEHLLSMLMGGLGPRE